MAIGVPYKAGVNDVRESPAIDVLEHLICRGAIASYHDDFVPEVPVAGRVLRSERLDADVLAAQDCVAILTAHPQIDYEFVVRHAHLVFDARGVTRHLQALNRVLL
jgi:UDP-N-acetyl-D-glucosamine dehydrogenase